VLQRAEEQVISSEAQDVAGDESANDQSLEVQASETAYMNEIYSWAYVDPGKVHLLDRPFVVNTLLFGCEGLLQRAALEEMVEGTSVLQTGHVYGKFCGRLAAHIGENGSYEVVDVTPIQVDHARMKLAEYPHAFATLCDAAYHDGGPYDTVLSFFLLHEVPDSHKRKIVDNALRMTNASGKTVFVDYHQPSRWHPLKLLMSFIADWLEPFAKGVWYNEIKDFASDADSYTWTKQTFFGGLYQKVVAVPKAKISVVPGE
jgi:ubiquinone/menaquinone biosynthesis C-methylase UbiE